ncbi:phosphoenolpyruvate--protein phosphotransferase [Salidesulfovibrio onnuriiensis]|uniref:phosphoenolpyruvate--protein phosphotransferase n=1 Tax=Salidesulfovibrio onnuriiensis TaxID=2583823 RepID=UPI0011CAF42B|nr:phosphoenolpyruvate--protein phosphotransferase [Salidesulfovibrio onnuriiensis]
MTTTLTGIAVSPGLATAPALVLRTQAPAFDRSPIPEGSANRELARLKAAMAASAEQLTSIMERVRVKMGEEQAAIFEGHLMILEDEELAEALEEKIRDQRHNAPAAVEAVCEEHATALEQLDDEYLRARAVDMRDMSRRVVLNCLGIVPTSLSTIDTEVVLVADDLTPSQTAVLDPAMVRAIITEKGNRTSHTAIMAASMEIPAIVGTPAALSSISDGDMVAVDAEANVILVNPSGEELQAFDERRASFEREREELAALRDLPAVTTDGVRIKLAANVGSPEDAAPAAAKGAEGVGLYRVEFLFMERTESPSEEEQYKAFKSVVETMGDHPVVIRTLDVGGDKDLPYMALPHEENPFLGCRGIRLCFERTKVFQTQLRAMLRAGMHGNVRIMVPMIASLDEVRAFKEALAQAAASLEAEGVEYARDLPLGIMVETPAAALLAHLFAKEVDFFSIGTNDLTQYTLAVDRMNTRIADLYEPLSPAVLQAIKLAADAARQEGKGICVCGQMAGEVASALLLIGMGVHELSMSAVHIPRIKKAVREHSSEELQQLAETILALPTAAEVKAALDKLLNK